MAKYFSITVETTSEAADIVSLILIEEGSDGVSIKDASDLEFVKSETYWDYISENVFDYDRHSTQNVYICGVFTKDKLSAVSKRLVEFRALSELPVGSLNINTALIDAADFENEWKKYYNIIEIGGIAIVPKWLEYKGDKPAVFINPGKAFGTGTHETTSMCLRLMQDFDLTDKTVFDIGCGSGILGLAALKLRAKKAVLTDIDPQAIESAKENATANGLIDKAEILLCDRVSCGGADVLFANLTADLLIKLKPLIKSVVKKDGKLIISGIIHSRAEEIKTAFADFKLEKNIIDGEWQAFAFTV